MASQMQLSLSNGIFAKYPLEKNLATVKRLGFENLEFNMKTVQREHEETVYEAKKHLQNYHLNCLTLHSATHYVGDAIEIPKAVYYLKVSAEFAYRLEASTMIIHSNVQRNLPEKVRHNFLEKIFAEIIPYTKNLNVNLSLENLSYDNRGYGKNITELDHILSIANDPTMGITLDLSHSAASGVTDSLLEKYHTRLSNIHLSNRAHKSFANNSPALINFIEKLHKYNYHGPLTMELSRKCTDNDILVTKTTLDKILCHNSLNRAEKHNI